MTSPSFLPATALVAIALFALKELFEAIKKWRGNIRKLRALKHLFAIECELNEWLIGMLRKILDRLEESESREEDKPLILVDSSGKTVIRFDKRMPTKTKVHGMDIPTSVSQGMDQNLLETAVLSRRLFNVLQPAIDASRELSHLRNGLITYIKPLEIDADVLRSAYLPYARKELDKAHVSLEALYLECTGNKLLQGRIR